MESKWFLLVARNLAPLHASAEVEGKKEGIKIGKIYWRSNTDLIVKYKTKLAHILGNIDEKPSETNFMDFTREINQDLNNFLDKSIEIIKQDLHLSSGNSLEDVKKLYLMHRRDMTLMILAYTWIYYLENVLKEKIDKEKWKIIEKAATSPCEKTMPMKEWLEIAEVGKAYGEGRITESQNFEKAEELSLKYGFIHSEYVGQEWGPQEYIEEIKSLRDFKFDNELEDTLSLGSNLNDWLINCMRKLAYIFDEGKSALIKTNWAMRKTISNLGYNEKLILNMFEPEFFRWLETEKMPSKRILEERNSYFGILINNDFYKQYSGKEQVARLIKEQHIREFDKIKEKISELKGQIAYKGIVKGKVKVILTQEDLSKMNKSDVLVTSMTTPELVKGMLKASAFITDEGGITCHAAIIAREMSKPCIIGTKKATKVLKDGMIVEVDADNGIVRIIEGK